jgi:iron complex outermembrane receptor protein
VSARTLLNAQPWTKPVDTVSANLGLRFEYQLDTSWRTSIALNKHKFKRDDFTAFPYGCSNEGDGYYPGYCSNGDYDVYDYQSTGEKKSPFGAQALVHGKFNAAGMAHELSFGGTLFKRHDSYGDYVYDYAGSSNIYHNAIVDPAAGSPTTGPVFERRTESERAVFVQDIAGLTSQLKLHTGLRHVQVKRNEYGVAPSDTSFTLPNASLVFNPTQDWTVYGSLAHGLEHGGVAPIETTNKNTALDPSRSKQIEFGVKGVVNGDTTVTAALFQIRKGLEYTQDNGDTSYTYVRNGTATHRGLELGAQGKLAAGLHYNVSMMAIDTQQDGTGLAGMDGKQVTNVPKFKSSALVEYAVASLPGLKVNGVWQYAGKKAFDVENVTMVPSYSVFDLGASYALRIGGSAMTVRANLQNAFDKFYWRDVTPALGGYLIPGAPRTVRVSAQFDF